MMATPKAQQKTATGAEQRMPAVAAEGLRVMLVGRTGLDAKLRLDSSIELIRAKTALDAVGELAAVAGQNGALPLAVIVAAGSDPGRDASGQGENIQERQEFIAALRRVGQEGGAAGAIRVLRIDDGDGEVPAGFDGVVKADADVGTIRALVGAGHNGPEAHVKATQEVAAAGADLEADLEAEMSDAPPAGAGTESVSGDMSHLIDALASGKASLFQTGDEVLVRLLLQGRDLTDAALEIVRRRLGGRDVVYVTAGRGEGEGAGKGVEASVAWRGRVLGRLRSREVPIEELAQHASWLASWLVLRDQHAQLREAAFADPLTGAHNRRYFDQFLTMAMDEARRERRGVTLLVFDIDDFKRFNDEHGHAAGDEILKETVRLLRSVIRPSDRVCRIGGDEFAVIFHEPTGPRTPASRPPNDVCEIAERFQREIHEHRFPKLGREAPGRLTISGGLATYPWDGRTPEGLLGRADELAMQSKRAGKNCITFGPGAEQGAGALP
jgi:diguanylate cyclase (GGDEF)-like protein